MIDLTIGFIGQGWIGKHYADDFESRGYTVVRYSTEPQHVINAAAIGQCDIVFIAVPTPTVTVDGTQRCDISIVREVLHLVGEGKIAVIKSTIPPGTTCGLQSEFPTLWVFHSPEFLTEANAAYDASHPEA
jgi:UDP-glucose 6-dehydrogenase